MIKKLETYPQDQEMEEIKSKINEIIDELNKGNIKRSDATSVESYFDINYERIVENLKLKPIPNTIYKMLQDEELNLFLNLTDHDKKYIERRCNIEIEKYNMLKPIRLIGKPFNEVDSNKIIK